MPRSSTNRSAQPDEDQGIQGTGKRLSRTVRTRKSAVEIVRDSNDSLPPPPPPPQSSNSPASSSHASKCISRERHSQSPVRNTRQDHGKTQTGTSYTTEHLSSSRTSDASAAERQTQHRHTEAPAQPNQDPDLDNSAQQGEDIGSKEDRNVVEGQVSQEESSVLAAALSELRDYTRAQQELTKSVHRTMILSSNPTKGAWKDPKTVSRIYENDLALVSEGIEESGSLEELALLVASGLSNDYGGRILEGEDERGLAYVDWSSTAALQQEDTTHTSSSRVSTLENVMLDLIYSDLVSSRGINWNRVLDTLKTSDTPSILGRSGNTKTKASKKKTIGGSQRVLSSKTRHIDDERRLKSDPSSTNISGTSGSSGENEHRVKRNIKGFQKKYESPYSQAKIGTSEAAKRLHFHTSPGKNDHAR
eukprot:gb/GECG01012929.1/.p1 GENE.gb/GECG01012929.1/~~gb/GECG01012929.1/.p1  ORF type:complete len:419 (+),score=61.31 gb/GECG01012929.1/:1-1257(+)